MDVALQYLTGFCWLAYSIWRNVALGSFILRHKYSWTYSFLAGYLAMTLASLVFGMPCVIFNLNFNVFYYGYMVCNILACALGLGYWIYRLTRRPDPIEELDSAEEQAEPEHKPLWITQWWPLIVVMIILTGFMFTRAPNYWMNGQGDDGYYVNEASFYLKSVYPYIRNYGTGQMVNVASAELIQRYLYTQGMENAFFIKITGINIFLFVRFFMAIYHALILCTAVSSLTITLGSTKKHQTPAIAGALTCAVLLMFEVNYQAALDLNIFSIQDTIKFYEAMYYGGNLTRMITIVALLLPIIPPFKMDWKTVGIVILVSLGLLSRSFNPVPVIVLAAVCYLQVWLFFRKKWILAIGFLVLILGISAGMWVLIPPSEEMIAVLNLMKFAPQHYLLYGCAGLLLLFAFILPRRTIKRFNTIVLMMFVMSITPVLCALPLTFSVYNFAFARLHATIQVTIFIAAFGELMIALIQFFPARLAGKILATAAAAAYGGWFSMVGWNTAEAITTHPDGHVAVYGPLDSIDVMLKNPLFEPEAVLELGQNLELIADVRPIVLMEEWNVLIDNYGSTYGDVLNSFVPDMINISALHRFRSYTEDEYSWIDRDSLPLMWSTTDGSPYEQYQAFADMLNRAGVNTFVTLSPDKANVLSSLGFYLDRVITDHNDNPVFYLYLRDMPEGSAYTGL